MSAHIDGADISAFLDGELDAPRRERADAHMAACAVCRGELESLRHMKAVLSSAPRKNMPAELALALERRLVAGSSRWKTLLKPAFWVPVGAVAAAAVTVVFWMNRTRAADELPLEPLLAAHARYSAEALVPEAHLVASAYSDQLATLDANASDSELE